MALLEDMNLLSQVELLRSLGEEKLRLIAFGAERRRFQPGQVLFREDAPADGAFVIAEGTVALSQKTRDGADRPLTNVGPGTLLGELALISPITRSMTATAEDDVEVMRINRPLFHRMLEEYPEIADTVRERITDNLTRLTRELGDIAPRFSDDESTGDNAAE
ncbi:MAG: protein kinase [Rhizobiales bacterium]|nr:protein kinase [Hyphomicrobiales bacterium]